MNTMSEDKERALTMYEQRRIEKTDRQRKKFLEELATTGKIAHSARVAGYKDSSALFKFKRESAEFAAAWADAEEASREIAADELFRRGVEGVDKAVYYKGEVVGWDKEYDTQALVFWLKGNYRQKFGDSVQVSGVISHSIGVAILPLRAASIEDWERAALDVRDNQKLLTPPKDVTPVATATPELVRG
jgi:hypothetical protein